MCKGSVWVCGVQTHLSVVESFLCGVFKPARALSIHLRRRGFQGPSPSHRPLPPQTHTRVFHDRENT